MKLLTKVKTLGQSMQANFCGHVDMVVTDLLYKSMKRYVSKDTDVLDMITIQSKDDPVRTCNVHIHRELLAMSDAIFTFTESVLHKLPPVSEAECMKTVRLITVITDSYAGEYTCEEKLRGIVCQIRRQFPGMIEFVYHAMLDHIIPDRTTMAVLGAEAFRPLIKDIDGDHSVLNSERSTRELWSIMINFGYMASLFVTRYTPLKAYTEPTKKIHHRYLSSCWFMEMLFVILEVCLLWIRVLRLCPPIVTLVPAVLVVLVAIVVGKAADTIFTEYDRLYDYEAYGAQYEAIVETLANQEVLGIASMLGFDVYDSEGMVNNYVNERHGDSDTE